MTCIHRRSSYCGRMLTFIGSRVVVLNTSRRLDMRNRRASVVFVLITMFIDVLGMGLVIPILPKLVQSLLGGAVAESSFVFGVLVSIYAVMHFLFAPVLGALSDRFGRRPIILLALVGLGFDYVLLSLAPTIWGLVLRPL